VLVYLFVVVVLDNLLFTRLIDAHANAHDRTCFYLQKFAQTPLSIFKWEDDDLSIVDRCLWEAAYKRFGNSGTSVILCLDPVMRSTSM
jgi:hypothetical protein